LQEARAASALNHPNIITIHAIVFEGDTEYMVMEYIAGKTLSEIIHTGGMPLPDVLNYGAQMADALDTAHKAGIIHRDFKPGNVMISNSGWVKILDFGLAKRSLFPQSGSYDATATLGSAPLTVEGSILGTIHYMSPEQAEGKVVDARSDMFSFGVVLYEMITGHRAFRGESPLSTLSAILRDDTAPMADFTADVPPALEQIVKRCLAKNPNDRWQSMAEVRKALLQLKEGPSIAALPAQVPPAAPPPQAPAKPQSPDRRRSRRKLAVLGGALACCAAAGVIFLHKDQPDGSTVIPALNAPAAQTQPPAVSTPQVGPTTVAPSSAPVSHEAPPKPEVPVPAIPESAPPPAAPPAVPTTKAVAIPDGLPVAIRLAEDLAADAEPGAIMHFTTIHDLKIGDNVVIPAGAHVVGEVVDGAKKKFLVVATKITFRLKNVEVPGGGRITLRVTPKDSGDFKRSIAAPSMPKHAKEVAAPAGTEYTAYTEGGQSVTVSSR
jgi:serine/threonine-protein kinase